MKIKGTGNDGKRDRKKVLSSLRCDLEKNPEEIPVPPFAQANRLRADFQEG